MGGVSLQIINLQIDWNYLDLVNILKIFSNLTWPHPSTHPSNHPSTKLYTHPWVENSLQFQIFKQNEIILISSSVIEFLLILGVLPLWGVVGRWIGMGLVWICGGCPMHYAHSCMHAHTCTNTPTPTCILNMINMDASMLAAICNFYTCIHVHACMCMHACPCAHVWGHPYAPRCLQIPPAQPPAPSPEPQGAQNIKIQ